jgi:hypothetical protein
MNIMVLMVWQTDANKGISAKLLCAVFLITTVSDWACLLFSANAIFQFNNNFIRVDGTYEQTGYLG